MKHDYGHLEEDDLGRSYDLTLARRLLSFARPYRTFILLSLAFILLAAGADVVLPYLTKTAIDRCIVPSARMVVTRGLSSERQRDIHRLVGPALLPTREPGVFFILPEAVHRLDRRQLALLEKSRTLRPEMFYPASLTNPGARQVVARHPGVFHLAGSHLPAEKRSSRSLFKNAQMLDARTPEAGAVHRSTAALTQDERNAADGCFSTGCYAFANYERLRGLSASDLYRLRAGDLAGVGRIAAVFAVLLLLSFGLSFVQTYTMELAGQRMMLDLRLKLFNHLQTQSLSFYTRQPVGRLVTRVTNDIQNLQEMFTTVLVALFKDAVLALAIVALMLRLDLSLALVSLAVVPLVALLTVFFSRAAREAFRQIRVLIADMNSTLSENIRGLRVVQAFAREAENLRRFREINHRAYLAGARQIFVFAVFSPCTELLGAVAIALIVWYGGGQVLGERLTLGLLVAFIAYMQMFFKPVRDLGEKYNVMQSALASAERIFRLLDTDETILEPLSPAQAPASKGEVEFRDVSFSYDGQETVLHHISFRASAGETVAIVGATGAGKTSVINLLERFYDPDEGRILLDGIDIRELPQAWLRSQIGLVMQDVFLFARSVGDNIAMGQNLSSEEMERVVSCANLGGFLKRLPAGLKEELHEEGLTLSSGERQLLALARALAYGPRVLVLDEATSSVDTETEQLIQEALGRLMKGRTTIAIAHRLSTIQKADRILVLHKGRVREEGTHSELLALKGYYWRLYELQYAVAGSAVSPA
ncbi:MAG: ABC transporter ATP-binding protein [Pseudomonadota bacterium]